MMYRTGEMFLMYRTGGDDADATSRYRTGEDGANATRISTTERDLP